MSDKVVQKILSQKIIVIVRKVYGDVCRRHTPDRGHF